MYLQQFILSLTCFELYLQFNHSNENVQLIFVQLNLFKTCAGILYLNKSDLPRHIFGRNASLLVWYSHHLDMHQPYLSISLSFLSNFFCKENSSVMAYRYRGANVFEKWQKALKAAALFFRRRCTANDPHRRLCQTWLERLLSLLIIYKFHLMFGCIRQSSAEFPTHPEDTGCGNKKSMKNYTNLE